MIFLTKLILPQYFPPNLGTLLQIPPHHSFQCQILDLLEIRWTSQCVPEMSNFLKALLCAHQLFSPPEMLQVCYLRFFEAKIVMVTTYFIEDQLSKDSNTCISRLFNRKSNLI